MRGDVNQQPSMFSYVDIEKRIPDSHPIRKIRHIVDAALEELHGDFDAMYSRIGRPSIPPEMMLRALLLQILFTIRSERQLMERLDYDLLFRWFVGLGMDDLVWNHSTFSKNRDRLLAQAIDERLFEAVRRQAYAKQLLSRDHFTIDGTLLDACASMKSLRPRDGSADDQDGDDHNQGKSFHGKKRSNETHFSSTDPDALQFRKGSGKETRLSHMGHLLTENRNGLIVDTEVTPAGTRQEWEAGINMVVRQSRRPGQTVGADKGYDTLEFVEGCRALKVTPHVAAKTKGSAIDKRTTRTEGYGISQRKRKKVEECFGWMKTFGLLHKLRHRGHAKVGWIFRFTAAAYNIMRMQRLMPA